MESVNKKKKADELHQLFRKTPLFIFSEKRLGRNPSTCRQTKHRLWQGLTAPLRRLLLMPSF